MFLNGYTYADMEPKRGRTRSLFWGAISLVIDLTIVMV